MEHVSVEFVVVVGWAGVGTILATNFLTGVERENVNLQRELTEEVLGTNWALDGRERHLFCSPVLTFISYFVNW